MYNHHVMKKPFSHIQTPQTQGTPAALPHIILASGSPRRLEILRAHGIEPEVLVSKFDEEAFLAQLPGETGAQELAQLLASHKAREVYERIFIQASEGTSEQPLEQVPLKDPSSTANTSLIPSTDTSPTSTPGVIPGADTSETSTPSLILGADTVVYKEGVGVLGKPANHAEATAMLVSLCNTSHEVITGVALINTATGAEQSFVDITKVHFGEYNLQEIEHYLKTEPPFDKAGSYAIQGYWGKHVNSIEGDLENVIGLPFYRLDFLVG